MTSRTEAHAGVVVYRRDSADAGIDAIDEYSRRLTEALAAGGASVRYASAGLSAVERSSPAWVLLQYNPFCYGRSGFAPGVVRDVQRLSRRGIPVAVMVHEAWIDIDGGKSGVIGLWQRAQLRALLRFASRVMASTEAIARELGAGAVHVPVGSNITPAGSDAVTGPGAAKQELGLGGRFTLGLFGRGNPSRALDYADAAIAAIAQRLGSEHMAVLNLGAGAPAVCAPAGVTVRRPGPLSAAELSRHLAACDLVLLPFTDGLTTRRSTLMAALAHGRPVLGLSGPRTDAVLVRGAGDALLLSPLGDREAYARAAAQAAVDRDRLQQVGAAGRLLYESEFDWPVVAGRVSAELEGLAGRRRRVVFVGHDIGGPGGMERHTEQLLNHLVDAGTDVTVVARTCELAPRPGLRFRRVPTPRRPFVLAYPTFFVAGALLVAWERRGLLHTTGAVVANRADLATVHYCHHAARERVGGSRASRPGWLHRLNEVAGDALSRAGERWCYRPARMRLLCAVSTGVAEEVRRSFPAMTARVRTVPNGVDASVYRPDAPARDAWRAELGLSASEPLALFVGGDWERKGLAAAVGALAAAPGWQLAVAGRGHPEPVLSLARAAGVEPRLRLLGAVKDMPRLYAAADAFVLPTSYEAFPLVTLEAAASALPMLVTRVNGVEEMLHDGGNGWFIEREPADIARRLNELSADPELACSMSAAARATAVAYSWDVMARRYLSLYAELAE